MSEASERDNVAFQTVPPISNGIDTLFLNGSFDVFPIWKMDTPLIRALWIDATRRRTVTHNNRNSLG